MASDFDFMNQPAQVPQLDNEKLKGWKPQGPMQAQTQVVPQNMKMGASMNGMDAMGNPIGGGGLDPGFSAPYQSGSGMGGNQQQLQDMYRRGLISNQQFTGMGGQFTGQSNPYSRASGGGGQWRNQAGGTNPLSSGFLGGGADTNIQMDAARAGMSVPEYRARVAQNDQYSRVGNNLGGGGSTRQLQLNQGQGGSTAYQPSASSRGITYNGRPNGNTFNPSTPLSPGLPNWGGWQSQPFEQTAGSAPQRSDSIIRLKDIMGQAGIFNPQNWNNEDWASKIGDDFLEKAMLPFYDRFTADQQYDQDFAEAMRRFNVTTGLNYVDLASNIALQNRGQEFNEYLGQENLGLQRDQLGFEKKQWGDTYGLLSRDRDINQQLANVEQGYKQGLISNQEYANQTERLLGERNASIRDREASIQEAFNTGQISAMQYANETARLQMEKQQAYQRQELGERSKWETQRNASQELQSRYGAFGRAQAPNARWVRR